MKIRGVPHCSTWLADTKAAKAHRRAGPEGVGAQQRRMSAPAVFTGIEEHGRIADESDGGGGEGDDEREQARD